MSTATFDEQLVAQPDSGVIYLSRRSDLRLVKTPKYPIHGPAGQKVGEHPGETIPFREGRFFCPSGGEVELEDGRMADAAEITAWLERHKLNGGIEEGFWRVDPTAPPISPEETQRLMRAAMRLDTDTLEAIVQQERAGWAREDLIRIAEESLAEIRAALEAAAEDAESTKTEKKGAK